MALILLLWKVTDNCDELTIYCSNDKTNMLRLIHFLSGGKIRLPICRRWLIFKINRHFPVKQARGAVYKDGKVPSKSTHVFFLRWTYQTPSPEAPSPPPLFSFGFLPPRVCPPERKQREKQRLEEDNRTLVTSQNAKANSTHCRCPKGKWSVRFKCDLCLTENSLRATLSLFLLTIT